MSSKPLGRCLPILTHWAEIFCQQRVENSYGLRAGRDSEVRNLLTMLRAAPHYYTTAGEIDRMIKVVRTLTK
jgi:selenocysteine lyase/cysteine desulfurase